MRSVRENIWRDAAFNFSGLAPSTTRDHAPLPATTPAEPETDDIGNSIATAMDLPFDGTVITAGIQYTNDADWFRLTADTAQRVRVVMQATAVLFNPAMHMFETWGLPAGTFGQHAAQYGSMTVVQVFSMEAGQTLYLQPFGFSVGSTYTVSATTVSDDQSAPVALPTDGTNVSGVIDFEDDRDGFTLIVNEGERIELRALGDTPGSGSNFRFALVGDGFEEVLTLVSDGASWVSVVEGLPAGTYQIFLSYNGGYLTDYELSARASTDDHPDSLPATVDLSGFGGSLSGAFGHFDDRDIIGIDTPAAGTYRIEFRALDGSFQTPAFRLYTANGTLAGIWGSDSPDLTTAIHTFDTAGVHYLELITAVQAIWGYDTVGDWAIDLTYLLSAGDDLLNATAEDDRIEGLGGNDSLRGLAGDDVLFGSAGTDTLSGGRGDDRLDGGAGRDKLHGGTGRDIFVVGDGSGTDTVSDFQPTWDRFEVLAGSGDTAYSDLEIIQDGADVLITFSNGGALRLVNTLRELVGPQHFTFLGAASAEAPHIAAESAEFSYLSPDFVPDNFEFAPHDEAGWHLA